MDGRCTLAGLDFAGLPGPRAMNVAYALIVADVDGLVDRDEVRRHINEALSPTLDPLAAFMGGMALPE